MARAGGGVGGASRATGSHRVEVFEGQSSRGVRYVTFPRRDACTLRDTPELDCQQKSSGERAKP
jgi:hypothetical protein